MMVSTWNEYWSLYTDLKSIDNQGSVFFVLSSVKYIPKHHFSGFLLLLLLKVLALAKVG